MGAFISKQPNGLYCRFSTVVDCPTDWNMTEEDFVELCKQQAEEEARIILQRRLKPFEWVQDYYLPNNMTEDEFNSFLTEVNTPVEELNK